MAQVVAEWMTHGYPRVIDAHGADIARFYERGEERRSHLGPRRRELQQDLRHRAPRRAVGGPTSVSSNQPLPAPAHEALDAEFFQARGLGAPPVVRRPTPISCERYGLSEREVEWDNRWWSPITTGEHLNMRENCGIGRSQSAFQIYELDGPGAVEFADYLAVNKVDKPVGRSIYTPWLTPDGGFHSDLTMMRIGRRQGPDRDRCLRRRPRRILGQASATCPPTVSVTFAEPHRGHHHPRPLGAERAGECSASSPTARSEPGGLALRLVDRHAEIAGRAMSAVPDLLRGRHRLGDLHRLGQRPGRFGTHCSPMPARPRAPSRPAAASTAPRVGSRRATASWGPSSRASTTRVEAGLARPKVKAADFIGKERLPGGAPGGPRREVTMCTFSPSTINTDSQGRRRYMQGGNEPILTKDGEPHRRLPRARQRASRPPEVARSVGRAISCSWPTSPPQYAAIGTELDVRVHERALPRHGRGHRRLGLRRRRQCASRAEPGRVLVIVRPMVQVQR